MIGELRYRTTETSHSISERLCAYDRFNDFIECTIIVPSPRQDTVVEKELTLHLQRVYDTTHSYLAANRDRVYKTKAKLSETGSQFEVDVVIHVKGYDIYPATVIMSEDGHLLLFDD